MKNSNMKDFYEMVGYVLTILCIVFLISLFLSLPVMWLWNGTLPELFNFKHIDWWMAWKLSMLVGFLFGTSARASNKS